MARDIETFKARLQTASIMEGERLRHELHLVAADVEKRTGLLNEKRAEVIAELYKRLVDFSWDKAWDAIQKGVPPLLTEIEREFRALLGVTQVANEAMEPTR